ncbi:hypothetical protein [Paraburkholderia sp. 32]|uniref:hypothetical protein n=1 Tax=Paraburkholderia sp. 32 TaxID=2991057 RepID=UPI003D1E2220
MTKPNPGKAKATVVLPADEARDLAIDAANRGMPTPEYLGYHVLRSAYGLMHPTVMEVERRDILGKSGTDIQGRDDA